MHHVHDLLETNQKALTWCPLRDPWWVARSYTVRLGGIRQWACVDLIDAVKTQTFYAATWHTADEHPCPMIGNIGRAKTAEEAKAIAERYYRQLLIKQTLKRHAVEMLKALGALTVLCAVLILAYLAAVGVSVLYRAIVELHLHLTP